jgi:hypothetical protein
VSFSSLRILATENREMRTLTILVAIGAWASCAPLYADGCPFPQVGSASVSDYTAVLMRLRLTACLGDHEADKAPLVGAFNEITEKPIGLGQVERLIKAVELLRDFAAQRAASSAPIDPHAKDWMHMERELADVQRKLSGLGSASSVKAIQDIVQYAISGDWVAISTSKQGPNTEIELDGVKLKLLAPPDCRPLTPCPAFDSQLELVRVANLMARLRGYSQERTIAEHFLDAKLATARWDSYRTEGHHQYIWEVWLNGKAMGDDLCPKDAGTGMRMGFCKVPTSQWIVLHPDAGLRWSNAANNPSELKAAFIVEALGYYRWSWKSEQSAQMTGRIGASLAAVYTDTSQEKRWSYGPMFYYEGYNLAVTKASGGRWSLVINLNLAERYFGRKQEFTNELQKIKKADLGELLFGQ